MAATSSTTAAAASTSAATPTPTTASGVAPPTKENPYSTVALKPADMIRGGEVDVLFEDTEEKKYWWTTGTIAAIKKDGSELLVHVNGQKAKWFKKESNWLAPRATYNLGVAGDTAPLAFEGRSLSSYTAVGGSTTAATTSTTAAATTAPKAESKAESKTDTKTT